MCLLENDFKKAEHSIDLISSARQDVLSKFRWRCRLPKASTYTIHLAVFALWLQVDRAGIFLSFSPGFFHCGLVSPKFMCSELLVDIVFWRPQREVHCNLSSIWILWKSHPHDLRLALSGLHWGSYLHDLRNDLGSRHGAIASWS